MVALNSNFIKIGDTIKLKDADRTFSKVKKDCHYIVIDMEENTGYYDGSSYIKHLQDLGGNDLYLKMYETYFEKVSRVLPTPVAKPEKKFQIGDKVICVRNTPEVQEGWIGFVIPEKSDFGFVAENDNGEGYAFTEDELELLNVSNTVRLQGAIHNVDIKGTLDPEHTGGSVNYYKVHVANPTTLPEAYDAEANDIIESLGLTFAEGNLFKAIWRMAADRNGKKKKGNNSVYDAEKLVFFAERVLVQEKAKHESK